MTVSCCPRCGANLSSGAAAADLCARCLLGTAMFDDPDTDGPTTLAPGTALGAFRIVRLLGRGGMAAVYEAEDTRLERIVALKTLPPEFLHDETFARRFEHEARVVASLDHPHIVPIYATGIDEGTPWMSMPLLTGGNVGVLIEHGRPADVDTRRMLRQVAFALDYAHARGIVHRDIKPTNLLIDGKGRVAVGDFGLARILDGDRRVTRTGLLAGTPHYMAPEQALGKPLDHRCDIYSLGIVAYELFAGVVPFTADSPVAVLLKHVNDVLPDPPAGVISQHAMRAIKGATTKDPAERWPSAAAFVDALENQDGVASVSTGQSDTPEQPEVGRTSARRRRMTALAGGALVAASLVFWFLARDQTPPARVGNQPLSAPASSGTQPASTSVPQELLPTTVPPEPTPARPSTPEPTRPGTPEPAGPSTPEPARASAGVFLSCPGAPPLIAPAPLAPSVSIDRGLSPTPSSPRPSSIDDSGPPAAADPRAPELLTRALAATSTTSATSATTVADVITAPVLVRKITPEYPSVAKAAQIEGDVQLRAVVGPDGTVSDVAIVRSVHPLLDEAARNAVRRYEYTPGRRNGNPESTPIRITVSFILR